jgi:hypothetical protein
MIRKTEGSKNLFLVCCADWESVIAASDESDAAAISIERASVEYEKNLNLSPTISVMNITKCYLNLKPLEEITFFYTPDVLADAGMYDLSKKYSKIIDLMKKDET